MVSDLICSMRDAALSEYLARQVSVFFPDNDKSVFAETAAVLPVRT